MTMDAAHIFRAAIKQIHQGPSFYLPPSLLNLSKLCDLNFIFYLKFIYYLLFG